MSEKERTAMRNTINVKSRKEIKHVISTIAPPPRRVHILHMIPFGKRGTFGLNHTTPLTGNT